MHVNAYKDCKDIGTASKWQCFSFTILEIKSLYIQMIKLQTLLFLEIWMPKVSC